MENEKYDIKLAKENQKELCEKEGHPHFAPNTGICWNCNRNIYKPIGWKYEHGYRKEVPLNSGELEYVTGITVDKASKELVTGCPHCNRSYCD